jgi:hypothetical protein
MLLEGDVKSAILLALVALGATVTAHAAPAKVRLPEGVARGPLVLTTLDGRAIAHGELVQRARGSRIDSRLSFAFLDGSVWDEQVTFSQDRVFRLETYKLVQRGPSFPTSEIEFNRRDGRFKARTQTRKEDELKEASGPLEMPDDVYNGMALVLLKNLANGEGGSGQMLVFTPKPRLIRMDLVREGEDEVRLGALGRTAIRYLVKLDVGGLAGVLATALGKDPPDGRYWLLAGDVPAFVRFTGATYLNGPIWRLENATVQWKE